MWIRYENDLCQLFQRIIYTKLHRIECRMSWMSGKLLHTDTLTRTFSRFGSFATYLIHSQNAPTTYVWCVDEKKKEETRERERDSEMNIRVRNRSIVNYSSSVSTYYHDNDDDDDDDDNSTERCSISKFMPQKWATQTAKGQKCHHQTVRSARERETTHC